MRWRDVLAGDVLAWDPLYATGDRELYLILSVASSPAGAPTTKEMLLSNGRVYTCSRDAGVRLDTVLAVLRGGRIVWGRLE